jgi:hypothetical protein
MSLLREFQRDYDAPLLITIPQGEGAWQDSPLERGSGRCIRAYQLVHVPVRSEAEAYHALVQRVIMDARYFLFFYRSKVYFF